MVWHALCIIISVSTQKEKTMKNTEELRATIYYLGGMAAVVAHMTLMGWMIVSF